MSQSIQRKYPPAQTEQMRAGVLAVIAADIGRLFDAHPQLQSAVMLVAQYWSDEADDAVHCDFIFSKLESPDLEAFAAAESANLPDAVNLPPGLDHFNLGDELDVLEWRDNGDAIPLFAAFTKEGSHQGMTITESGTPYALFRRVATGMEVHVVGTMLRPWLDGIRPEWDDL